MFEIMVFVLITSFYVALAVAGIILLYRIGITFMVGKDIKEKVLIAVLPLGIGVFLYVKNQKILKIYRMLIVILFITSLLASLFLFHRELGL